MASESSSLVADVNACSENRIGDDAEETQVAFDELDPLKVPPASTDDCVEEAPVITDKDIAEVSDEAKMPVKISVPETPISSDASPSTPPSVKKKIDDQLSSPWKLRKITAVSPCQINSTCSMEWTLPAHRQIHGCCWKTRSQDIASSQKSGQSSAGDETCW